MNNNYTGEGWFWKPIALITLTALITGSGFLIRDSLSQHGFITRTEAQAMIKTEAPYTLDRKFILSALEKIQKDIEIIKQKLWNP